MGNLFCFGTFKGLNRICNLTVNRFRTIRLGGATAGGWEGVRRAGSSHDGRNQLLANCTESNVNSESLDEKKEVVGEPGQGLKGNYILGGCRTSSQRRRHTFLSGKGRGMNGCGGNEVRKGFIGT